MFGVKCVHISAVDGFTEKAWEKDWDRHSSLGDAKRNIKIEENLFIEFKGSSTYQNPKMNEGVLVDDQRKKITCDVLLIMKTHHDWIW